MILSRTPRPNDDDILTGKAAKSLTGICFNLHPRQVAEFDSISPVDLFGNDRDFLFNREVEIIEELKI